MSDQSFIRPKQKDMPCLTGLRFVAAAYIVLLHYWRVFLPSCAGMKYWMEFLSLGYIAVSFFFVLSGYILAVVYLKDSRSFDRGAFWQARIGRIYPVYLLSLVLSAPFALIKQDSHSGFYHGAKALFLTATNLSLLQSWHPALSGNWNRPSWSVSVEAFFYLIFPLLGMWVARRQGKALQIAGAFWLFSIATSVVCLIVAPNIAASQSRLELFLFNPLLRLPEFMIGVCCGVWSTRKRISSMQRYMWGGVAACVLTLPLLAKLPWLLVSNGLLAPMFGAMVIGLSSTEGVMEALLGNRVMVRLGQASFSLYLLHFPVFFWMAFLMRKGTLGERFTKGWPIAADSPGYLALYFCLAVAVSLLSYSYFETPARLAVKERLARWQQSREIKAANGVGVVALTPMRPGLPEMIIPDTLDVPALSVLSAATAGASSFAPPLPHSVEGAL